MALEQDKVQYLDDWQDLKDYTKKKHEAAEKEKQDRDVTRTFVDSQISTAEQKDNQEEQAEYAKIYQKIADISAGGGVDLSPYLKIEDASANFATKSEIPSVKGYATTEYVNSEIQRVEEEIPSVENLATKNELEAVAAQIPDVSDFVTEQTVDEKIATEIAKVVADAPEDFDTLKEVADYIASDKTHAAEIETAISNLQNNKADASTVYTKEQADAKFLTEHLDISNLATKSEVNAALEEKADKSEIPSLEEYPTKAEVNTALENKADKSEIPVVPTVVSAFENDAHYLTEHQDISNLASKDELEAVEAQIPDVSAALEPYALKTDLPDTSGLASKAEVNAALENKADKAEIPVVPTKVSSFENDANYLTEHQDISNLASKDELEAVEAQIPDVSGFATKIEVNAALENKADKAEIPVVPTKVSSFENDANYLTQHQDISNLASKQEVADGDTSVLNNVLGKMWNKSGDYFQTKKTVNGKTALLWNEYDGGGTIYETSELKSFVGVNDGGDVSTGVHVQIYSKSKADNKGARLNVNPTGIFYGVGTSAVISPETELAVKGDIPSVDNFTTKDEVSAADSSVLKNILGRIWTTKDADPSKGCFTTKLINSDGNLAEIFNENDGGGVIFSDNTRKIKSFVGVNDGGDPSTGIHAQIYSKNVSTNEGARLNINPAGMFYGVGASTPIDDAHELAVKGDIPSVEGLVSEQQMTTALQDKATIEQVSTVDEKVAALDASIAEGYVPVGEYNALVDKVKVLQAYIDSFVTVDSKKREEANDTIIESLSDNNKSVVVPTEIKSIVYPETNNGGLSVVAPLADDSSVKVTSNKYFYLDNTSETGDTSTEIIGIDGATSATACYLTGTFDTLTLTNISVSKPSGKNAAVVSNVVIPETNETNISISVTLTDGATITNNSVKDITISNQSGGDAEPTIYLVAPNSTVTVSGGQYGTFESTVGDNTLYINKNVHINTLVVKKGNVIVNDYEIESHINQIQNDTEYTVTPKIIEVYNQSDWAKSSSTPALYEVMNDLTVTNRIAPGIFGSSAKIKLNGHTVTCSDSNAAFLLRGSSHYIIENGTIRATGYGIWLSGGGTVELKDVHVIADGTHSLYIEKANGKFITSGNCRFEVTTEDKKYTLNYKDDIWNSGYRTGFELGEGTEIVGQDVAASMSEPSGPVNMLPAGYHTESFEEDSKTIYRVVKDSE